MAESKSNPILAVLGFGWKVLDVGSRVIFIAIIFGFIGLFLLAGLLGGSDGPKVTRDSALVIAPSGALVEQLSGTALDRAMGELTGQSIPETLLRDVLRAINEAKSDKRIKGIVLNLNGTAGGWPTKMEDLGDALMDFRSSGKKVIAVSDNYSNASYYLASHADEVIMHPMGNVIIEGYGRFRNYYKEALDDFEVDVHVFKVGTFKSAVEPYLRNDMSPAAREANMEFLGDLWEAWLQDVADGRGVQKEELRATLAGFVDRLETFKGDTGAASLDAGLVDQLMSRTETREYLISEFGEDSDSKSYRRIGHNDYLTAVGESDFATPSGGPSVAVLVARGSIVDGSAAPGTIGGDTVAGLIRDARQDDDIKAIVLRVDSGGGSAFASEVIRREFAKAKADGIPVVVSMGSVAASGGYWISTSADEIWAHPTTVTGSIGIFGMFPKFHKTMGKAGLYTDGIGTTELAGAFRPDLPLNDTIARAIQLNIEHGYQEFLTRVGNARDMSNEEVDAIGQGRVWSGSDAFERGLVDKLGTLQDAIDSAASRADLGDSFKVRYIEAEPEWHEEFMAELLASVADHFGPVAKTRRTSLLDSPMVRAMLRDAEMMANMTDPNGVYAYSFISEP